MTTYGYNHYGRPTLYGRQRPVTVVPGGGALPTVNSAYLIDPFTAVPLDYTSALLSWNGPDTSTGTVMNQFRLLSSRYGFPVDENDGAILIDQDTPPGTSYVDQNVVPGQMTYYGFYILGANGQWIRAGFSALLMPVNNGYLNKLWGYLPEYMRDLSDTELTQDQAGNPYLVQFLQVLAWPLDYLKTSYDFLYQNQNNPMKMAFSDLAQLAGQLGMPFYSEIPAYYVRKAAANWAVVMQQRGSLAGISEHIELLSGFGADVQVANNILLEDDQSEPLSPSFDRFAAGIPYAQGEIVSWPDYPDWVVSQSYVVDNYVYYNGAAYQCTSPVQGVPPAGATDSGTYWAVGLGPYLLQAAHAVTTLPATPPPGALPPGDFPEGNPSWTVLYDKDAAQSHIAVAGLAGGVSTWEVLEGANLTAQPPAGSLTEGLALPNPGNYENDLTQNSLRVYNKTGSAADMWLRSLSRLTTDVDAGSSVPDPQAVVEHGVPVPLAGPQWDPTVRYGTGDVVLWGSVNYLALRASTGAQPPATGSTSEWAPLGTDERIPLMISAQTAQNPSQESAAQYPITPFCEWYDNWGNLISRVFARELTGYTYDSFSTNPGSSLSGRGTDTGDQTWTVTGGGWMTDSEGNAYATESGSFVGVTAPVSYTQAVTFTEAASAGEIPGLVFWLRVTGSYNFWLAGMTDLYYCDPDDGTTTVAATYTTPLQIGDRIYVVTNQATPEITVYRNVVQAYDSTTGNGQVAQVSGTTAIPADYLPASTETVYSGLGVVAS